MIHLERDKKTTFFYFKTDAGKLPQALTGVFTNETLARRALEMYQSAVRSTAEKNSSQIRKAKAKNSSAGKGITEKHRTTATKETHPENLVNAAVNDS